MENDATQTGAENLTSAWTGRASAMAQIAQQAHAQVAEDLNDFDEGTGQLLPKAGTETPEPDATEDAAGDETNATTQTPPADDLETIMVDGREVQVKRTQLLDAGRRTLQKEAAADRRLEEAAETLRRAKAYEQGLMRQPSPDAGSEESPPTDATNGNGTHQGQATPDIGALVDQRIWIRDADKAAQRFRDEFKDIVEDPLASRLVVQLENERLAEAAAEGKPLGDPWDAYRTHGVKIREWLGKKAPTMPADKADRKRDTVAVTGAGTRMQPPAPPKQLTTSEIIERQRLARAGRQLSPTR